MRLVRLVGFPIFMASHVASDLQAISRYGNVFYGEFRIIWTNSESGHA